jgi:hypothetical protein
VSDGVEEEIVARRKELAELGVDAGANTIAYPLVSEMLSEGPFDDRGLRLAPSACLRSGEADDVLIPLDGHLLLGACRSRDPLP